MTIRSKYVSARTVIQLADTMILGVIRSVQTSTDLSLNEVAAGAGCTDLWDFCNWPEAEAVYHDHIAAGFSPEAARVRTGPFVGRVLKDVMETHFLYERLEPTYRKSRYRVKGLQHANAS